MSKAASHRSFSNTRRVRILLEEDDKEDAPREAHPDSHQARRSNPTAPQQNMRQILLSRKADKAKPRKAPEPIWIDPKKLRLIEKQARRLNESYRLVDMFVNSKHAHLEDHISHCHDILLGFQLQYDHSFQILLEQVEKGVLRGAATNASLEHEYCKIAFSQLPSLQCKIDHIGTTISQLCRQVSSVHLEIMDLTVQNSGTLISEINTRLHAEYLKPRDSAKANIDKLLGYTEAIEQQYHILQTKGSAVVEGLVELRRAMTFLKHFPVENAERLFEHLSSIWKYHSQHISFALHNHRSKWLRDKYRHNPLGVARLWRISDLSEIMPQGYARVSDAKWMIEGLMLPSKKGRRDIIDDEKLLLADYLSNIYMKRWTPPKGPHVLDRHWRQLDIIAPFETLLMDQWQIQCEAHYLLRTLKGSFGPMWINMDTKKTVHYQDKIVAWIKSHTRHRRELLKEYQSLAEINWVRLEIDEKLHRLGERNDTRARGLFVPAFPLSENLDRFEEWVKNLGVIAGDGWISCKLLEFAETSNLLETLFPLVTQNRHDELQWDSDTSKNILAEHSTAVTKTTGTPHERPGSRRSLRVKRRQMRAARGSFKWQFKVPSETAAEHTTAPDPLSAQQPGFDGDGQAPRKEHEGNASTSDGHANGVTRHTRPPARGIFEHRSKIGQILGLFKRSFSTSPSTARHDVHEDNDEYLQVQSQARGAPPIETSSTGFVYPEESETSFIDQLPAPESDSTTTSGAAPLFWSHNTQLGPGGQKIIVHYCRSLRSTEEVAKLFLGSKIIGFDLEWKAQASATDTIQNNLSLIQIANEERIALFQVALFRPARNLEDLVAPSLKLLLESPEVMKVGVAIKADCTRLRKFLGIDARSTFELSHLYKLVKYSQTSPKLVNKRPVNLSDQIEEHLGLPLEKSDNVRCGDWTRPLNYRQVQYAATDPYACLCLFNTMEQKRLALDPMPPFPAFAELNLPIFLSHGEVVNDDKDALPVAALGIEGYSS
ncbi:hypothetical protein N7512_004167 [Penicillium capsulatum]|nr:hypothetical protein N7512_004167 [Penicillium capsulatum]